MNPNEIKIRKTWSFNPATKVHSTPKGEKGYNRSGNQKTIENEMEEYKSIKEQYEVAQNY